MIIVIFLDNLDATAVNLAIPKITADFQLKEWMVQWLVNGYLISSACFFIIGGKLGDVYGKRNLFVFGLSIFIISSFWASIAISSWQILSARTMQGIGFAMTYPMSVIILSNIFPNEKQGMAMGLIVSASGFSISAGPIIGSILLHWLNWRVIFVINIPLGLLAIIIILMTLKGMHESLSEQFIDIKGAVLLLLGLFLLIYNVNNLGGYTLYQSLVHLVGIITAIGILIAFFIHERWKEHPLLQTVIFSYPGYVFANVLRMIYQCIFIGLLFILPVTLQNIYSIPVFHLGFILLPLTILMGAGSPLVGQWIKKVGLLLPLIIGSVIMIISCIWLSFLNPPISIFHLDIGILTIGIAFSLVFPCLNTIALTNFPSDLSGQASGFYYTNTAIAGGLGVGLSSLILKVLTPTNASGLAVIDSTLNQNAQSKLIQQFFYYGWANLFIFYAFLALIALILTLYKKRLKHWQHWGLG